MTVMIRREREIIESGMRSDALDPKAPWLCTAKCTYSIADILAPTGLDAGASEISWSLAVCLPSGGWRTV